MRRAIQQYILTASLLSWLILAGASVPSESAALPQTQSAEAIKSAKRALKTARPPWYDADADAVRQLVVETSEQVARKDWQPKGPKWTWNWGWGPTFPYFGKIFELLIWGLFIAAVALLVYALVQAFLKMSPQSKMVARGNLAEDEAKRDARRIENLPVSVKAKKGNFLDIAKQFYDEGNFGDAIVYLFSHRLLQLDRAGHIRLTKGKTNRQYLTEIRNSKDLRRILGQTIVPFEDVFFGKHNLTRVRFEECWQRNKQFEQLLQVTT